MFAGFHRPDKRSMIAGSALVVWVLVLFFGWAIQPIEDTVPVNVNPTTELAAVLAARPELTPPDAVRAQLVVCNSLFSNQARNWSEPLPQLTPDFVYARPPCISPHRGAQVVAVVNVFAVIAVIAAWIIISRRFRLHTENDVQPAPSTPTPV